MDHSRLEKIYNDIRQEPYMVSTQYGKEAPNCYFKGLRFMKSAGELGYPVKARIGDFDWKDTPTPDEVIALAPPGHQEMHFYVELYIDNQWRTLDPSIDDKTEKLGFRKVSFEGDQKTCFDLHKLYSQDEQVRKIETLDERVLKEYFTKMGPFLNTFNEWIEAERAKL